MPPVSEREQTIQKLQTSVTVRAILNAIQGINILNFNSSADSGFLLGTINGRKLKESTK